MFSDNSYVSGILDRQGFQVALEQRRLRVSRYNCYRAFWHMLKKKNPKIVVMSPTVETKSFKKKEVVWQQYHLCMDLAEQQILGGKHFLILGPEGGKIWWLKKVQYLQKKHHCQWTLLRDEKPKWIFSQSRQSFRSTGVSTSPRVSEWFLQSGKYAQFLEVAYQKQK